MTGEDGDVEKCFVLPQHLENRWLEYQKGFYVTQATSRRKAV